LLFLSDGLRFGPSQPSPPLLGGVGPKGPWVYPVKVTFTILSFIILSSELFNNNEIIYNID